MHVDRRLVGAAALGTMAGIFGQEFLSWTLSHLFDSLWASILRIRQTLSVGNTIGFVLGLASSALLLSWCRDQFRHRYISSLVTDLSILHAEIRSSWENGAFRPKMGMQSMIATAYDQIRRLRVQTPVEWDGSYWAGLSDYEAYEAASSYLSMLIPPLKTGRLTLTRRIIDNYFRVDAEAKRRQAEKIKLMRQEEARSAAVA